MAESSSSAGPEKPERTVRVKTSDGEEFVIPLALAQQPRVTMPGADDAVFVADDETALPLLNVAGPTFAKMIEYWKKHAEAADGEDLASWDREFFSTLDRDAAINLTTAANYLDTKSLFDAACDCMAGIIKDMPMKEVREVFGIKNDFAPEEEEELLARNAWAED